MSVRLRTSQVWLLLRPLCHAVPWSPLATGAAVSALAMVAALTGERPEPADAVVGLRLTAILLGTGTAFAMIDQMSPATVSATPRWLRQWLRLLLVAVPAAAGWALAVGAAGATLGRGALPPMAGLVVEALVCALVGLGGGAVAARHWHTVSAAIAGPMTQFLLVAGTLMIRDQRSSPWVVPGDPRWDAVHRWWWYPLALIVVVIVFANRDTWSTRTRWYRR